MAAYACIVSLCTFALFLVGDAKINKSASYSDQVAKCCEHAIKEVIKENDQPPNCQAIGQSAERTFQSAFGFICRTSAELCCIKQLQEKLCNQGKAVAMNGGRCASKNTYYGGEDHQECCYCCYLGMVAKRRNLGCGRAILGFPCEKAFSSCCLLDDPHPSGFPTIFAQPSVIQTPPPSTITSRRTCSSLGCAQSCVMLSGVPTCVCRRGFQISKDGRTCDDVNECSRIVTCPQNKTCQNTYGSYNCIDDGLRCAEGLEVDSTGVQCKDIDECLQSPCEADKLCENTRGSYRCSPRCPVTYVFKNGRCEKACGGGYIWDGKKCADEDECQRPRICRSNEQCENTVGSYRCITPCRRGYERVGGNCVDIDECEKYKSSRPCGSRHCRNIPGSYRCEQCPNGFELSNSRCRDINECDDSPCSSNAQCQNMAGSYRCVCDRGYALVDSQCRDINECDTSPCRGRNEICVNIPSSYRCKCKTGYERSGPTCYDINECRRNLCAADETCINRPGTYRCVKRTGCPPGYRAVGKNCVDVNECLENTRRCPADSECINTNGSYRCRVKCSRGYERIPSREDCRDIDECLVSNACRSNEVCRNTRGSYRCTRVANCPSGYERFSGRCEDKDECLIPNICRPPRPICKNIPGSYRCEYDSCSSGFERGRNGQCQDINECRTGKHICKPRAEQCINLKGTYSCRCNRGYVRTGGDDHCHDRDECLGPDQYCAHKCINTEGSFRCECRKGYVLIGRTNCYDVNECSEGSARCDHNCVNTQGSYYCQCNRGYTLHSNGKTCSDIDECKTPNRYGSCSWRCLNSRGSFKCLCPKGFQLRWGRYCVDIDECTHSSPCPGACVNTKGGYECLNARCPNNFFIKRSETHCTRKNCELDDTKCREEIRKSIRWHGRGLPNNAKPGAFSYLYNITTTGYRVRPAINFSIKRGNVGDAFEIVVLGYGKSHVRNRLTLTGPRAYVLEFAGEVVSDGKVTASFITLLHIYVSEYEFF